MESNPYRQVDASDKQAMKKMRSKMVNQITDIVKLVLCNLDRLTRKKINTLIIVDVHARYLVDGFVCDSILDAHEFRWERQLVYLYLSQGYCDGTQDDVVRQCTGLFLSGYEYMGRNGRLVITRGTDAWIMTLTHALCVGFSGWPAGPAGTVKTETVKYLAKALSRLRNAFNCDEDLGHKDIARIFSGPVQTGGWG